MFLKSFVSGLLVFFLIGGSAGAQQQAPLTDKQITSFITSFAEAREIGRKYNVDDALSTQSQSGGGFNLSDTVVRSLRSSGGYGEFRSMARRHGFASPEAWVGVAERVMKAFVANKLGAQRPQMTAQMQQVLRQIESNPNIPPQQKQAMLQQMRASAAMMESSRSTPQDKAAVQPHMATLEAEFEKDGAGPARR